MDIDKRTYVVAEAGVNHNGSLDSALRLVDAAAEAGADAVKFQTFRAVDLLTARAPKAEYQRNVTGDGEGQLEMIRRLEMNEAMHAALIERASVRGIEFLSTPFDSSSLSLLVDRFGLKTIKLSSGEITNAPFLLEVARRASNLIVSTGMSNLGEVEAALGAIAFGFIASPDAKPGSDAFEAAFASAEGQEAMRRRVVLLHCTTEYPAPFTEVNLRAMDTLATAFGLPVGYSDHTSGIHVSIAAVARGARIVEKHFTLDRNLPGPDHQASLEPTELAAMVRGIRDIEVALGDGIKRPAPRELANRAVARKVIVAAVPITTGEVFSSSNLATKRAGVGGSPFRYWDLLGSRAARSYEANEPIDD
jgi:N-acetylneuraminate synthase